MGNKRYTYFLVTLSVFLLAISSSCQKDDAVKETVNTTLTTDSTKISAIGMPGNYLAATGTLKIKIKDSTYTFDASRDSIAFINVHSDTETRYFGITAINKEHTMSFGISSAGFANSNINSNIAGSQFLLNQGGDGQTQQYSLSQYSGQKDFGNINIVQYNQKGVLARGTFFTFLAKDEKADSPFYKVEGSFELYLK
ncbi:MAG: hypothetical protein JWP94_2037 [Mucilaginibacter sp.]|nr:hypothetical protein [Mucilaginibacter sp.]